LDTKKRIYISSFTQKKKELEELNLHSSKIKTVAIKMRICNAKKTPTSGVLSFQIIYLKIS